MSHRPCHILEQKYIKVGLQSGSRERLSTTSVVPCYWFGMKYFVALHAHLYSQSVSSQYTTTHNQLLSSATERGPHHHGPHQKAKTPCLKILIGNSRPFTINSDIQNRHWSKPRC